MRKTGALIASHLAVGVVAGWLWSLRAADPSEGPETNEPAAEAKALLARHGKSHPVLANILKDPLLLMVRRSRPPTPQELSAKAFAEDAEKRAQRERFLTAVKAKIAEIRASGSLPDSPAGMGDPRHIRDGFSVEETAIFTLWLEQDPEFTLTANYITRNVPAKYFEPFVEEFGSERSLELLRTASRLQGGKYKDKLFGALVQCDPDFVLAHRNELGELMGFKDEAKIESVLAYSLPLTESEFIFDHILELDWRGQDRLIDIFAERLALWDRIPFYERVIELGALPDAEAVEGHYVAWVHARNAYRDATWLPIEKRIEGIARFESTREHAQASARRQAVVAEVYEALREHPDDLVDAVAQGSLSATAVRNELALASPEVARSYPVEWDRAVFSALERADPVGALVLVPEEERAGHLLNGMILVNERRTDEALELLRAVPWGGEDRDWVTRQQVINTIMNVYTQRMPDRAFATWVANEPPGLEREMLAAHLVAAMRSQGAGDTALIAEMEGLVTSAEVRNRILETP